jgi:anti-sigma B factor antagonist
MKIKVKTQNQISIITLNGKVVGDVEVGEIHKAIKKALDKEAKHIVVNLEDVSWMGSIGIGILICCLTSVKNAGGEMKLSGLSEKVEKIIEMTKLDDIFDIYPTTDSAVASFD